MSDDNDDYADFLLEEGRQGYKQGDKTRILASLETCILFNRPVPAWLKNAFLNARRARLMYEIKSWDEVFGRPLKKGGQPAKERRYLMLCGEIFQRVHARHKAGEPIDKLLFEAIGEELKIGGTTAAEIYYSTRKNSKKARDQAVKFRKFKEDLKKPENFRKD